MNADKVETLRTFMADLVSATNLREASRLVGRGREQVRRFIAGDIRQPHKRTLRAIERLWARSDPERHEAAPPTIPLCSVLPAGVESATAEIRNVFSASPHPSAAVLERWLINRVRSEYSTVPASPRQRTRP